MGSCTGAKHTVRRPISNTNSSFLKLHPWISDVPALQPTLHHHVAPSNFSSTSTREQVNKSSGLRLSQSWAGGRLSPVWHQQDPWPPKLQCLHLQTNIVTPTLQGGVLRPEADCQLS